MIVAVPAGLGLAARVLYDSSDELYTAADALTSASVWWVLAAVLAEALCYLSRGSAQWALLAHGSAVLASERDPDSQRALAPRPPVPVPSDTSRPDPTFPDAVGLPLDPDRTASPGVGRVALGAAVLAGDAAAYCLPFGFAAAGVVVVEQLRRRRIDEVLASWAFAVATVVYVAVLAVLAIVAVQLAAGSGDVNPIPGLREASLILLAVLVVVIALTLIVRRRGRGGGPPVDGSTDDRGDSRAARARIRLPRPLAAKVAAWWAELRMLRLSPRVLAAAAVSMLVSWLADISVLAMAFLALGLPPPWLGLILAYCAGQIASSVPVTPGGLGVVEGSLTLALVAFGGSATSTLAAVLLYRLISYWSVIPTGALAWLVLRATSRPAPGIVEVRP